MKSKSGYGVLVSAICYRISGLHLKDTNNSCPVQGHRAVADWTEWTDWAGELSAKPPSLQILFSSFFGKSFTVKSVGADVDAALRSDLFVLQLYRLPLNMDIFEGGLCI